MPAEQVPAFALFEWASGTYVGSGQADGKLRVTFQPARSTNEHSAPICCISFTDFAVVSSSSSVQTR